VSILHGLIRAYPFATLVTHAAAGMTANHLPFELVDGVLHGHVARGNELAQLDGAEVLLIFQAGRLYQPELVSEQARDRARGADLELCGGPCAWPVAGDRRCDSGCVACWKH
jgi:Transcriptional regulator